jgi:tetratricopeptide (TPR) repeat protein
MRFWSGITLTLSSGVLIGGCAAAATGGGGGGPSTSAAGCTYAPGVAPARSEFTQTAILASAQGNYENALAQARLGIAADSTNPQHFFLAGEAAAGLGNYELADSMWNEAERLYPAYREDIEPAREVAWGQAFNEGVEAYNADNAAGAIEAWRNADMIYPYHPNAAQNLGIVLMNEQQVEEAIEAFRRGLAALELQPCTREFAAEEIAEREEARGFLQGSLAELLNYTEQYAEAEVLFRERLEVDPENVQLRASLAAAIAAQGREAEAAQIFADLLSAPGLDYTQLFQIGVSLYQADQFAQSAQAFERVTQMQPNSRDAWYNYANALYAAENWAGVPPVANRLLQVDPLNENGALILANAYRELGQNDQALATLQRVETLPVILEQLTISPTESSTTVRGRVKGYAAAAGSPVRLRFTFYSDTAELGNQTVTVNAPARDATAPFEVTFAQTSAAYKYEVLP